MPDSTHLLSIRSNFMIRMNEKSVFGTAVFSYCATYITKLVLFVLLFSRFICLITKHLFYFSSTQCYIDYLLIHAIVFVFFLLIAILYAFNSLSKPSSLPASTTISSAKNKVFTNSLPILVYFFYICTENYWRLFAYLSDVFPKFSFLLCTFKFN